MLYSTDSLTHVAVTQAAASTQTVDTAQVSTPGNSSVGEAQPFYLPKHSHITDAPTARTGTNAHFTIGRPASFSGIPGDPRPQLPGYDTGVMCMLILTFMILAANFRHYSTFLKTFSQDLWKVRNRSNVFDDHTMSETRVMSSFIMVLGLSEGIIVYSSIASTVGQLPIFGTVAIITLIAIIFYMVQVLVLKIVGYTFTSAENALQWVKGFKASQALLGIALVVPAMLVLFNPGITVGVTIIALTLYVVARIIFIFKGFRIFYTNSFSLIYFILYLCTLEILPPIIVCKAAVKLALLLK